MSTEKEMTERESGLQAILADARVFFRWWISEIQSLLPASMKKLTHQPAHRVVLDFGASSIGIIECRGQHETELGQYLFEQDEGVLPEVVKPLLDKLEMNGTEVVIYLPQDEVLCKTFTLPIEAEENLHEVLGYEMDRQTPFKAEQVYFDHQIVERLTERGQLRVQMIVVPRSLLEKIVANVTNWGLSPDVVTASYASTPDSDHCVVPGFNLLPKERRSANGHPWNRLTKYLAIAAAVLVIVAISLPLLLQQATIDDLEGQIASLKQEADAALDLRNEITNIVTESRLFLDQKQKRPPVIEMLNELSRILPDHTWLQRLEIKNKKVTIQGVSSDASALIELIENSGMFQNATFQSPIVQDPRTGRYRFQIVADLSGGEVI
jgi:general secretion pathway protein L